MSETATVRFQSSSNYYIWTPRALTGEDLTPEENVLLKITGNIITSLGRMPREAVPAGVQGHKNFYSLEDGLTLVPGLIDAHVHLALDGGRSLKAPSPGDAKRGLSPVASVAIPGHLDACVKGGIAAVRDGGDRRALNLVIKKMVDRGLMEGPRVISTGQALRKAGSYGSFLGGGYLHKADIPAAVDRLVASGVDQIKVLVSGIVSFQEFGKVGLPALPPGELGCLVSCAHERGKKVMAHASSVGAVDCAIEAGVDTIEHGYFLNRDSLERMALQQIAWVPTIVPVAVQLREPLKGRRSNEEMEIIKRVCQDQMGKLAVAQQMGVPIGMGTDAGTAGVGHGTGLLEEMMLYLQAGLSPRIILRAATSTNAAILGLAENLGSIGVNKEARFLAVGGDPLHDPGTFRKIRTVYYPTV